jgi:hypothetical protein
MDSEEREICTYLKGYPGQFVAAAEIARRAGGRKRFHKNPHWAIPFLTRLVERKVVEPDATGHYRLIPPAEAAKKKKQKRWVSPQIQAILERSGRSFEGPIAIEDHEGETPG